MKGSTSTRRSRRAFLKQGRVAAVSLCALPYDLSVTCRIVILIRRAARVSQTYSGYGLKLCKSLMPTAIGLDLSNNPHLPARAVLPGLKPISGMFLVDSGADFDIEFYSPFVKRHRLLDSAQQTTEASTLGIGGASKVRMGRATSVQIGRASSPTRRFTSLSQRPGMTRALSGQASSAANFCASSKP